MNWLLALNQQKDILSCSSSIVSEQQQYFGGIQDAQCQNNEIIYKYLCENVCCIIFLELLGDWTHTGS